MSTREQVEKMLKDHPTLVGFNCSEARESREVAGTFDVTLEREYETTVTFKMLDEISELFGTKKIDVRPEERTGGYCESCAYTEQYVVVDLQEARLK